jgi:transcriptional regulator of acetoin/glycerol metabolism
VIAATHRQIDLLAARGTFRADLYARLSGHVHYLTPLRDRREDLGSIVAELLARDSASDLRLSAEAGRELIAQDWPLNIRQLEQSLTRAVMLAENGVIAQRHLQSTVPRMKTPTPTPTGTSSAARDDDRGDESRGSELRTLLERHQGNVSEVARALGCSRMQVHRLMQKYALDPATFRR